MTAIAAFMVARTPVVFGDLMLSAVGEEVQEAHMPAAGNVADFVRGDGYRFAGFSQKVVLISERCAVAWSGDQEAAGLVIQELRRRWATLPLTVAQIHELLSSHPRGAEVTFVGWIWEGPHVNQISHRAVEVHVGAFGRVALGGSGLPTLLQTIRGLGESAMWSDDPVDLAAQALTTILTMSAILLQRELHGRNLSAKLEQLFGGAFEAAFLFGTSFLKVGDITFVLWEAKVSNGHVELQTPLLFLKQDYADDFLLLKSGRFQYDVTSGRPRGWKHAYSIPPMYMTHEEVTELAARTLSFQSKYFLHIFFAYDTDTNDEWRHANCRSIAGPAGEPSITFDESDTGLTWTLSDEFVRDVSQAILSSRPKTETNAQSAREVKKVGVWLKWALIVPVVLLGIVMCVGSSADSGNASRPATKQTERSAVRIPFIGNGTTAYAAPHEAKVREACDGLTIDGNPLEC